MTVFSCEHEWEAMLTCIYEAWTSRKGQQNIKLVFEPIEQYSLFDEYIHVDADQTKAERVMNAVVMKISANVYNELAYSSMSFEEDVLDNIYRIMLLGFAFGPNVFEMMQYEAVMRNNKIRKYLGKEINHFQEFSRFHEIAGSVYVAHIEPKSRIVLALGPIFADRMPSENWMIVDDVHKEAVVHPKNEPYYLRILNDQEYARLLATEEENDDYTDMWKAFFEAVAIKERANARCQRNLFPIWTRKHAVEFL